MGGLAAPAALPTATSEPAAAPPTFTATFLPPPTVTPFPTVTPRPADASLTGTPASTSPAETGPAPTASGLADQPTPTGATAPASPTTPPSSSAGLPEGVQVGRSLVSIDFSRGWPDYDNPTAKISMLNGGYMFEVGPYDAAFVNTGQLNAGDFYAQVEATLSECTEKGGYGLLFRFVDDGNFYEFTVRCNGTFSVLEKAGGSYASKTLLKGDLPAGLDAAAATTHVLGVLAQGDTFSVYMDGMSLGQASDDTHEAGDIAPWAEASTSPRKVIVLFDNLEAWALP
jgi:hypothetical protein